jgi:hypothetical protein
MIVLRTIIRTIEVKAIDVQTITHNNQDTKINA